MSRRRLLVVTSSDDEDEAQQRTQNHSQPPQQFGIEQIQAEEEEEEIEVQYENSLPDIENVALGSSSGPIQPQLISDDDEDFIDVPDHLSPPPANPRIPSPENSTPASATPSSNGPSHCPISRLLRGLGLKLRNQWLESCVQGLETAVPGFSGLDSGTKAKFCFEQFLNSDMNFIGGGVLPLNVDSMHLVELAGPFVLQVDEVVNLSCPLRERYKNSAAGPKRCLKLSMTDGVQRVFGMEYRPINDLQVLGLAGFKVAIKNVVVRRGLLMLVPEVLEVLGGSVQELEAARQRLVAEINKPPRGKRTRQGVLPPLATRATMAAWSQTGTDNPVQNNTSDQQSNNSTRQDMQGAGINASTPVQINTSTRQDLHDTGVHASTPVQINTSAQHSSNSTRQDVPGAGIPVQTNTFAQNSNHSTRQDVQGSAPSGCGINTPRTTVDSIDLPTTDRNSRRDSTVISTSTMVAAENDFGSTVQDDDDDIEMDDPTTYTIDHNSTRESTLFPTSGFTAEDNVEDVEMDDPTHHPYMLIGDKELPFTYLQSLLAKFDFVKGKDSRVQGKIKCFLTDVRGFNYRDRETYDLRVFVEDGSLIHEILIHHDVVQNLIGYTPGELTAALRSSDRQRIVDMKEHLGKFKDFLVNFEGYLLIEINESSELPIALEMTEGCPPSDACLLLNRCLSSHNNHLDPIVLSP